jgi:hypothetical protein
MQTFSNLSATTAGDGRPPAPFPAGNVFIEQLAALVGQINTAEVGDTEVCSTKVADVVIDGLSIPSARPIPAEGAPAAGAFIPSVPVVTYAEVTGGAVAPRTIGIEAAPVATTRETAGEVVGPAPAGVLVAETAVVAGATAATDTSPASMHSDKRPAVKAAGVRTKRVARPKPVEAAEFLELPSYNSVRFSLIEDPARRPALPGKGKTWIAGGLNDELGPGARGIYTTGSRAIATCFASSPLGSQGSVKRAMHSGEIEELSKTCVMRPGLDVRHAHDLRTGIRSKSVTRAVIYQANFFDPHVLAAEIKRVCKPGAHVTLCGLGPCSVNKAFDDVFVPLYAKALRPLWSPGERQLLREFSQFPLDLEDSVYLMNVRHRLHGMPKQFATAKWTFAELLAFLRTYPSIQRIEKPHATKAGVVPPYDELRHRFADGLTAMREAWDGPRKARDVRWQLWVRSGFLPR